ncbi:MAG: phage holin family protein [Oceanipulchritudo sp.]
MNLLRSLSLVGGTLGRSIETRLRLFTSELEYERLRIVRWMTLCVIGSAALGTGLITSTALIVYSVGVEHRVLVLIIATATLLLAGIGCIAFALHMAIGGRAPFESSTNALKEDCECLASLSKE